VDLAGSAVTIRLESNERVTCTFTGSVPQWEVGDVVTRTQLDWDVTRDWYDTYNQVYAPSGIVEVGIPGTSGFSLRFTASDAPSSFFVQDDRLGPPGALVADLVDATGSASHRFGGEVLALRLNVDFAAGGFLAGSAGIPFGRLTLCAMEDTTLNGRTVSEVLDLANTLLGAGTNGYSIDVMVDLVTELNSAFGDRFEIEPSVFAQAHLMSGMCP
jgi:hypothetical protein